MSVKIRLTRVGRKKKPSYRVVVMDSRKPRDGAYIEQIGRYEPLAEPSVVEIDNERALDWLSKGAQPTERARKLLEISGAWTRFRVSKGDIHTVVEATPAPELAVLPDTPAVEELAQAVEETAGEVVDAAEEAAEATAGEVVDAAEEGAEKAVEAAGEETP